MKELSIKEEKSYYGGGGITAAIISALARGINTVTDIGRYLGSSIKRFFDKDMCKY